MYEGRRVAAVVPALNEAAHVAGVITGMPAYVDAIIVVDDHSTDGTAAAAEAVGDTRVEIVRHERRRGVGGATVSGMRCALERGADLVVKVDGDGQMDPARMESLLAPLVSEGYDYAKGNRFLHPAALRQMPVRRLLGNFALTFLTKLASGYWHIFDPQNGYVAATAATLRGLDLERLAQGFFFENDLLIHLNVLGCRVKDVAIPARYGDEHSALRVNRVLLTFPFYLALGFCTRIWEKYVLRDFSPIAVFWLVGIPLTVFGGLFGMGTWVHSLCSGQAAATGTVMLSVLPFLLGFELILQAIILEIRESPR
jgi:glycosyltransferase involved in cell wall biosynthesis